MTPGQPRLVRAGHRAAAFCLTTFLWLAASAFAAEPATKSFDLPAGPAEKALREFAAQSGVPAIFPTGITHGVETKEVKGTMTPKEALDRMLSGTPLIAEQDAATGTLTVTRLATVEQAEKNVSGAIVTDNGRPGRNGRTALDENGETVVKLDTFEVFERKTLNMDIRRTRDDVQPYVVFDEQAIRNSGSTNLNDFLRNRLPMNSQRTSTEFRTNTTGNGNLAASNLSEINLRGLGSFQTLVLVDGRRIPSISAGTAIAPNRQPDINGIPMVAIDRIEILPSTASGIYGGGATGGVVNIILKKSYNGAELNGSYGMTSDGNAAFREASINGGVSAAHGTTQIAFRASVQKSDPLLQGDRPFLARYRQSLLMYSPPTVNSFPNGGEVGYTSYIKSSDGSILKLKSGASLNSVYATVPNGYAGPSTDAGAALASRAGVTNYLQLPNDGTGSASWLTNSNEIRSFGLTVRQEIGSRIEMFADVSGSQNKSSAPLATVAISRNIVTLSPTAANNPFQQSIDVLFPVPSLAPAWSSNDTKQFTLQGGFSFRLPHEWTIQADYSQNRSTSRTVAQIQLRLNAAGQAALRDGTVDVLKDVNAFPIDYDPYLLSGEASTGTTSSEVNLRDATLRFGGPVKEFARTKISLAGYLESRNETTEAVTNTTVASTGTGVITYTYIPAREERVNSAYLETNSEWNNARAGAVLAGAKVQLSARIDRYDTTAQSPSFQQFSGVPGTIGPFAPVGDGAIATKFAAGLMLKVGRVLALRSSYGTGFLPAAAMQTVPSLLTSAIPATPQTTILDPKRGSTPWNVDASGTVRGGTFTLLRNGSRTLDPEDSRAVNAGVIITPMGERGARLSIDYTQIVKSNEIGTISQASLLQFEDQLPGRIVRGPNLPGDPPNWAGPVTSFDTGLVNIAHSRTEAVDATIDWRWDAGSLGSFKLYAVATRNLHLERQLLPNAATTEGVGLSGLGGTPGELKWKGNGGFDWEHGSWIGGWNLQYYHSYSIDDAGSFYVQLHAGNPTIPAQIYNDVYIGYRTKSSGSRWLRACSFTLTIRNLENKVPPSVGGDLYSSYADPRLRWIELSVNKKL